jgi:hypothetical protein
MLAAETRRQAVAVTIKPQLCRNVARVDRLRPVVALVVATVLPAATQGQEPPDPPNLLVIYREEVRPGKGAAHSANEAAWAAAFAKGQAAMQWLGMTSVSGPSEAWFLSGYDSYAAYEQDQDAIEANAPSGRKETSSRPLMASC